MQVLGVVQVFQQGIRELCRFFELCRLPIGNSRITQVLGIIQFFHQGIREFPTGCRLLGVRVGFSSREFVSYVGFLLENLHVGFQFLGTHEFERNVFPYIAGNLHNSKNLHNSRIPCWEAYITPKTYIIREFPNGKPT